MKSNLLIATILFAMVSSFGQSRKTQSVPLKDVLGSINASLEEVEYAGEFAGDATVSVALNEVYSKEGGVELNILIFKIGGKRSTEKSQTITYDFKISKKSGLLNKKLTQALSKAINEALTTHRLANENLDWLEPTKLTVSVSFTISKEGSAGFEIQPLSIGLSGKIKKKNVHTVTIVFNKL